MRSKYVGAVVVGAFLMFLSHAKGAHGSPQIVRISGDQAKAIGVAIADFEKRKNQEPGGSNTFSKFMRDISNYEVTLRSQDDGYAITVRVNPPPGTLIAGGGAKYTIANDHQIKRFVGEK